MTSISEKASILHRAARNQTPVAQFSLSENYNLESAYQVQHELIQLRQEEGFPIVGIKMGFTSHAKMKQMGVNDMIIGQLTSDMQLSKSQPLVKADCCHPRAEPEIAFRLSEDIDKPLNAQEVMNYIDGVAAAIEVIDSRYENFKFSLEDVVADNCSSCAFMVGQWCDVPLGLNGLDMIMSFDGLSEAEGSSDAILDNPFEALAAATRLAHLYNIQLSKGMIVLAGASTAASFINKTSTINLEIDGLGRTLFTIV
ncbi:fumarylacetoacetate hydrolase family protein [Schleiferiaceae bacterium]|mgnify:CR=1 FL=1|jgi:2-oxo-3-hexenedioate decarboxylase|nr:4-oxalocrotonate decarboxylase [Flavobacteriales bacterium]MDC1021817.1 fumarylacetoacetate hydrolase family protein [Schleiferiaceae bacterium]|tara:strand:+ start:2919 stop:3683 length:765 start_codon:yes stop_codon:yes gene_type:complete